MTNSEFNKLDNSLSSFEVIKHKSENYYESIDLDVQIQQGIQQGSKWKKGLSESQIEDFQNQIGIEFSDSLKNYYRIMNGLDRPGLNNNGEEDIEYGLTFYSYPDDIDKIKSVIEWILEDNHVRQEDVGKNDIPFIFPFVGHRFLILNKEEIVLSMYGDDIIYYAENLSKGIASTIFPSRPYFDKQKFNKNSFWNKKVL